MVVGRFVMKHEIPNDKKKQVDEKHPVAVFINPSLLVNFSFCEEEDFIFVK